MVFDGDFGMYVRISETLLRVVFDEEAVYMTDYIPKGAEGMMTILKDEAIHMHAPQEHPLCAACGKDGDNA